jgi:hypothetical protein
MIYFIARLFFVALFWVNFFEGFASLNGLRVSLRSTV